jgi:hypothetical protein
VAEFGIPVVVAGPEPVELARDDVEADACPYCQGEQFIRETYATDRRGVRVVFWWCQAVGWGAVQAGVLCEARSRRSRTAPPPAADKR